MSPSGTRLQKFKRGGACHAHFASASARRRALFSPDYHAGRCKVQRAFRLDDELHIPREDVGRRIRGAHVYIRLRDDAAVGMEEEEVAAVPAHGGIRAAQDVVIEDIDSVSVRGKTGKEREWQGMKRGEGGVPRGALVIIDSR